MNQAMTTSESSALLGPVKPRQDKRGGCRPYTIYRRIRLQCERICELRESNVVGITEAAQKTKFRTTAAFETAYQLLKKHGAQIAMESDWSGLEDDLFHKFPGFRRTEGFVQLMEEFGDPRAAKLRDELIGEVAHSKAPIPVAQTSPQPATSPTPTARPATRLVNSPFIKVPSTLPAK
jgi:hypothetical protein